jgi:alpha-L-fucosidase
MNDTWGFKRDDNHWKSPAVLIRQLAATSSRGGNYLLNIGPTALGEVPPPTVERLAEVGKWMRVNEESIRGTFRRSVPVRPAVGRDHAEARQTLSARVHLARNGTRVLRAEEQGDERSLARRRHHAEIRAIENGRDRLSQHHASSRRPDDRNTVVALDIDGAANVDPGVTQQPDGVVRLFSYLGDVRAMGDSKLRLDTRGVTTGWTASGGSIDWTSASLGRARSKLR